MARVRMSAMRWSRAQWIGLMARARPEALAEAAEALGAPPAHRVERGPEVGLVMVRGRAGGTGDPFNLGEATAVRCVVTLEPDGPAGVGYALGRDRAHARRIALCDALMQTDRAQDVEAAVLEPLAAAEAEARAARGRRAAATRVDFFTLVRGED